jgi:5'-3' exonuclease
MKEQKIFHNYIVHFVFCPMFLLSEIIALKNDVYVHGSLNTLFFVYTLSNFDFSANTLLKKMKEHEIFYKDFRSDWNKRRWR